MNESLRPGKHFQRTPLFSSAYTLNYGPVSRSADTSERTAAASRQRQRGDSRLGSNAAQRQLVLLRRRLRLIIRRLTIRLRPGGDKKRN